MVPERRPAPERVYLQKLPLDPHALLFVLEYQRPASEDYARLALQLLPDGKVTVCGTNTIDFSIHHGLGGPDRWYAIGGSIERAPRADRADLRVGYAYGRWKTADTIYVRHGKIRNGHASSIISHLAESAPLVHFQVDLPKSLVQLAVRIVAFDKHGRPLESYGSTTMRSATDYAFKGAAPNLARIEIQTQPYTWAVFKGVAVRPRWQAHPQRGWSGPPQFAVPARTLAEPFFLPPSIAPGSGRKKSRCTRAPPSCRMVRAGRREGREGGSGNWIRA